MSMGIPHHENPLDLWRAWFADAEHPAIPDRTAMALATADAEGRPSVRMVLLKDADETGFVFYTNVESRKGAELLANPNAALCFYWEPLHRQVRVEGPVAPVSEAEADAYFASRPKQSQLGAWASQQSRPLEGRLALEKRVAYYAAQYGLGAVPRPPYWRGFRLAPTAIEFWQAGAFRLHDRLVYRRHGNAPWSTSWLYP